MSASNSRGWNCDGLKESASPSPVFACVQQPLTRLFVGRVAVCYLTGTKPFRLPCHIQRKNVSAAIWNRNMPPTST